MPRSTHTRRGDHIDREVSVLRALGTSGCARVLIPPKHVSTALWPSQTMPRMVPHLVMLTSHSQTAVELVIKIIG